MTTLQRRHFEPRSVGFGVMVLTAGLIWLLYNVNLVSLSGVNIALSLWPLALIAIGADLLLQQSSPRLGLYTVIALALLVVLAALFAPQLGIGVLKTNTNNYADAIGEAERAVINLHPGVGELNVQALEAEGTLFSADVTYLGELDYSTHGTTERRIDLGQREVSTTSWFGTDKDLAWNVGLTTAIPLNLNVNTGVGDANLDFTGLTFSQLTLAGGVGSIHLTLPDQERAYQITITSGVGDMDVRIPENANVTLTVTGGVGDTQFDVPDNTPLRVRVSSGLGSIHLPNWLEQVNLNTDEQVWQTSNFEDATRRVSIIVQSGLGSLTIH